MKLLEAENMLNIDSIKNGIVIDHIQAGRSHGASTDYLRLDKLDCTVAIIKNAPSEQDGPQGHHQDRLHDGH